MSTHSARLPYAAASVGGIVLWTVTSAVGDRTEPWDTEIYWSFSYPLSIAASAVLGYLFPTRAWRWAVVLTFMQGAVMLLGGSGLGLLPLGLVLLSILSLPPIAAALLAAKVSARRARA